MEIALITDTSVLLNLLAAGCAEEILAGSGREFLLCKAVAAETLVLRNRETQESHPIDLAPFIEKGLLKICELSGDQEFELLVEYASLMRRGSEGEAMSFAIAESRSLPVAIDDERAIKRARKRNPSLKTVASTTVLRKWQERQNIPANRMREILMRIRLWASYCPGEYHPDYEWWVKICR
jgi:predicted nucleic acid-binding protein